MMAGGINTHRVQSRNHSHPKRIPFAVCCTVQTSTEKEYTPYLDKELAMYRFIVLVCVVGLGAGGVIVDNSRQDSQSIQGGDGGEGHVHTLTRDQLVRQKFILDILQQVESPLQNEKLLELNKDGVLNENMYLGPLDDNMRILLDLIRTNRVLGRNNLFSLNNEEDLRQMAGLYLLLVRSRDFEAFQRTAVYARVHISPVLFVNALILAIEDRADTKALVSPALHEILPNLHQDDSLGRQVKIMNLRPISNNGNSIRPNVQDVISLGRQTKQINLRSTEGADGQDVLNRAKLWMPWRDMHRQLAIQRSLNGKVMHDKTSQEVVILTSSNKDGLIANDIGLRSSLNMLFVELILKQSVLRNTLNSNVENILHSPESSRNILESRVSESDISNSDRLLQDGRLRNNLNNAENRDNIISERQRLREENTQQQLGNNKQRNVRGFSDESDWLNAHLDVSNNIRDPKRGVDHLLTTPLNNERLIHLKRQDPLQSGAYQINNVNEGRRQLNRLALTGNDNIHDSGIRISSGQLLLHQLQQLVARLNIEDIALRRTDNLLNSDVNNLQHSNRIADPSIDIRLDDRQRRVVLEKINEISERLNGSLQKIIRQIPNIGQIDALGSRLSGDIDHIVSIEILNEIISLCEYVPDGQVSSILQNPTTQLLMRHIVNTIESQLQRLRSARNNRDIGVNGVNINDAAIDRLHTYLEYSNVDLSNMLRPQPGRDNEQNNQIVIGRIPRQNHKPFGIKLDVNSDHDQRVVVRTLLVPKVDALGNRMSPLQQRQNVVLLDIASVNLKLGRNLIVRQSQDITWTGRDSTTYTEMYQRVMNALQSDLELNSGITVGQNNLLPHRLLIPRGRSDGLQMQLLIAITPAEQNIGGIHTARNGLDALVLDNLPITYPLDRDLNDLNTIISLPNVHMSDVLIYHDDQLEMPLQ